MAYFRSIGIVSGSILSDYLVQSHHFTDEEAEEVFAVTHTYTEKSDALKLQIPSI